MKKKLFAMLLVSCLLGCSFMGCSTKKAEETTDTEATSETEETTEAEEATLQVCSGCEDEKECQTYTVDDTDYIVCDDCYPEFAEGMGLIEHHEESHHTTASNYTTVCTGCKEAKDCKTYCVNDTHYLVCDDCYPEFATGMGLDATVNAICSLCEVDKICKTYTVDGQDYIVCDDCYNEFATAFGLN